MATQDTGSFDRYDKAILRLLQTQGRMSNQDLAQEVGLSASPCLRRVKALEDAGIITGYRAHLDAKKINLGLTALIQISMDKHTPERFEHFEKAIKKGKGEGKGDCRRGLRFQKHHFLFPFSTPSAALLRRARRRRRDADRRRGALHKPQLRPEL